MAITKLQPFNLDSTANYTFANITAGNANLGNQATANFFIGSGNNLSNIQGANVTGAVSIATTSGTVTTGDQPNITSTGTLTGLSVSGNANIGNIGTNALVATGTGSFGGNVNMTSKNIISLADPVSSQDAATKNYVDTVAQGLDPKTSVVYATTISLFENGYTYNNGTSGVGATLTSSSNGALSIDGNIPTQGDRVLVKNEVGAFVNNTTQSAAFNGIYIVTQVGSVSLPFILTRSTDFDIGTEMSGAFTFVESGSTNADTGWVCTTNNPITIGTTLLIWVQFSGAGTYQAGTGLTLTGATFSVNTSQTQVTSVGTLASLSVSGNIISGNANLGNAASANYFIGNGFYLTGVDTSPANISNGTSNVNISSSGGNVTVGVGGVANVLKITTTGANISGTANITGNVSAPFFIGNGAFLTGVDTSPANISNGTSNVQVISSGGNVTTSVGGVANVLVVSSTGANVNGTFKVSGQSNLGAVGNVVITGGTADYVLKTDGAGNLSWTAQAAGSAQIANGNSNVRIATANGNVTIAAVGNSIMTITGTGANISGTANVTGNITGANLMGPLANGTSNVRIAAVNGNVTITSAGNTTMTITGTGANISGTANVTGNVNAPFFIGNGFYLTGVDTSPSNISNGTSNVQIIQNGNVNTSVNGNANVVVVTGLGSNITGYLSVSGNVSGGNISTSGQLTSTQATGTAPLVVLSTTQVANLNAAIAGTVTTNAQPNITSLGSLTGLTVSNATGIVNFSTTANVALGAVANLHISGGSANYVLKTDGTGNLDWVAVGGISVISSISNGNSNVDIATSNGNVTLTAVGNTTMTVTGTGANISGYANITGNVSLTGANVNLGAVGNLRISGGASSYVLSTDGSSNLSWIAQSGGGGNASAAIQEFSASAGQTTFTVVGGYQVGSALVFVNGIQMNNADYTAANGTTVVLSEPRNAGDVVRILSSMASPSVNINSLQNFSVAMSIALGV